MRKHDDFNKTRQRKDSGNNLQIFNIENYKKLPFTYTILLKLTEVQVSK